MRIVIDEDYIITSDERNYILNKVSVTETGKNKGEEYQIAVGFYPTFDKALVGYVRKKELKSNATTISEQIEVIRKLNEEIIEWFNTSDSKTNTRRVIKG